MTSIQKFIGEIAITLFVAFALSSVLVLAMSMVAGGIGNYEKSVGAINTIGGILFGGIVGYKLNSSIQSNRK